MYLIVTKQGADYYQGLKLVLENSPNPADRLDRRTYAESMLKQIRIHRRKYAESPFELTSASTYTKISMVLSEPMSCNLRHVTGPIRLQCLRISVSRIAPSAHREEKVICRRCAAHELIVQGWG